MSNCRKQAILHIDDDPVVTALAAEYLERAGYCVESLNDPTQAMDRITQGSYRVVILDIQMPGIDGLDLLRQIKKYDGGVQVIMLTGMVTMSAVLASLRGGAEACLFKPLEDYRQLLEAVDNACRKLDRWWNTLEEIAKQRRTGEANSSAAPIANPTH